MESVLRVRTVGSYRELRFWLNGKGIRPTFGDSQRILGFEQSDGKASLSYLAGAKMQNSTIWREAEWRGPVMTSKEITDLTRIMHTSVRGDRSTTWFRMEERVVNYVHSRLDGLSGEWYIKTKGDIGEEACSGVLTAMGCEELMRHPFGGGGQGCNQRGPDSLMRPSEAQGPHLVEYKWHRNVSNSMDEGKSELLRFIDRREAEVQSLGVRGGYIASLNWNRRSGDGTLLTRKVWSIEQN